jgi:hypothetical protein
MKLDTRTLQLKLQSTHYTPVSLPLVFPTKTLYIFFPFHAANLIFLYFIIFKTPKSASFVILSGTEWQSLADVSEQPIGPLFKGQEVQDGPGLVCRLYGAIRIALVCKNGGPRTTRNQTEYF